MPRGARKWCSDHCRKEQYKGKCEGCGESTWGDLCDLCARARVIGQRRVASERTRAEILSLRVDGLLNYEIAERLHLSVLSVNTHVWRMRRDGIDVPKSTYDRSTWMSMVAR